MPEGSKRAPSLRGIDVPGNTAEDTLKIENSPSVISTF
ncbi:hypothetical protein ACPOL_0322 [Acidisarcina polymorpha]|uniref:Uncharacterized protein n=1 Tax=Acidisarcina polymorpha TaxID=2211140 RepID=A0A2Z5FTE7_9BACT|nr:hypothetical protein ACPOL_0322 [Acidisarcina polymorpha]